MLCLPFVVTQDAGRMPFQYLEIPDSAISCSSALDRYHDIPGREGQARGARCVNHRSIGSSMNIRGLEET
jgi:hypothetical protein